MQEKIKIAIIISGGVLNGIYTNSQEKFDIEILDYDNYEAMPRKEFDKFLIKTGKVTKELKRIY